MQNNLNKYEHEIIIGVDGCENTLNKLMNISGKYKNLKIIMMNENYGLFITLNTLLTLVKYDNIIKFDSDDIMLPNLLDDVMSVNGDLIRFLFYYYHGKNQKLTSTEAYANGVYKIKKHVYDVLGGYQPWKCAADTEFLERFKQCGKFNEVRLNKRLFYYRQHNNSLSRNIPYVNGSLRFEYHKLFKEKKYVDFNVKSVVGDYKIILDY